MDKSPSKANLSELTISTRNNKGLKLIRGGLKIWNLVGYIPYLLALSIKLLLKLETYKAYFG